MRQDWIGGSLILGMAGTSRGIENGAMSVENGKDSDMVRAALARIRHVWRDPNEEVQARQIRIAFEASPHNLAMGVLAALVILTGATVIPDWRQDVVDPVRAYGFPALWAAAITAVLARGIQLSKRFELESRSAADTIQWGTQLALNGILAAVVWGSSAAVFLPFANERRSAFVVAAITMVIMGGAGAQAAFPRLVIPFVLTTAGVFAVSLLAMSPPHVVEIHAFYSAGIVLFAVVALFFAYNQQRAIQEAVELGLERSRLLEEARAAAAQAEEAKVRAEAADRAKSRYLAATSHDLRQPLHALGLYAEHLDRIPAGAEVKSTVRKIGAATASMEEMLNAVLDASKLALGVVKPNIGTVSLDAVFHAVANDLEVQAASKGLTLDVRYSGHYVVSDRVHLQRILRNLVLNSIRYTSHGGVILRSKRLAGGEVIVQVGDSGIGIAKADRGAIFEEFVQLDNPERDRRKGLGLGLSNVRQLCELLEHPLSLRSRVGKGTIFRLAIPASSQTSHQTEAGQGEANHEEDLVSGAVVVMIDDMPDALESMCVTLRDFGCQVIGAPNVVDAVAKIEAGACNPDIIISDFRLAGGETGVTAIATLRGYLDADGDAPATPAFLITGDASTDKLRTAMSSGLEVLHKPVNGKALWALMNRHLSRYHAQLLQAQEAET